MAVTATPTNTITVINKDTGATIGSYSTMTEVMAVTTAGGNFEWVFDGEITKGTGSGFKTTAASITISGKGKYTGDNFWFGNDGASAATHVTVSKGTDVEFAADGGINFRYDGKKSSTMIVEDGRFYLPSAQMPGNGLFTVKGYGTTAKTDAEGNTIYGFEMGDGTYAANLQVDNVLTVYDKYGIYEGNVAFVMSNYGFAYFGGLTLKSGAITNARIENSKLQIGMSENNQGLMFAGTKSTAEFIGDSEYYGQLAFNSTDGKFIARDTTVATVTGITVKNKDNGIFISDSVELNITGKINTTTLHTYKDQGVDINNDGKVDDKDALPFTVNKDVNKDGDIDGDDKLSFTILRYDAVTSTINVTGMETKLTLNDVNRTVKFNVSLTSEDFAAIANPADTHTLFEIKGIVQKTYTATFEDQTGTMRSVENVIVTDEATQTNGLNSESPLDNVTITIDGNAYTIGETITIDGEGYKISWEALGEDGVKNDLVATHLAPPPITVTAGTTLIGKFETLNDAAAAINNDKTNAEPFAVILNADSELTDDVEFTKDTVFSGTGKITGNQIMFGNKTAKLIPTLIIAEGSDITFNGSYFQGTHNSSDTAATMTINNARLFAGGDAKWHGTIKVTGSGAKDADGNIIYGFKGAADSEYKENLYVKQHFSSQDRYATLNREGLLLTAGAWVSIKGGYTMSDDSGSLYNITDSKLTVDKYANIVNKDTFIKVMGDSVVSFGQLGYDGNTAVSAGAAVINVSGLQSEISAGTISAAITEINFTLTAAEVGALTESYTLFELTDAAAAFDANTAISVMIDGASYKLNDRITINDSIFEVALGGTDANDLVIRYVDPYRLDSQNFVTDTTLSGTAKAYYRNPEENYSGFSSIYNVGSGATLTIAKGVAVDLERNASGTKSIILVGANDYFASQGFEATGAGDLVVNGTLDVCQLNAMADGTITVNGELNITTACIEKGSLIYNSGSTGLISCLNIFNNANATFTVNGLATLTLAGEPAHALKDNGAADIADRFIVNVTDAELADMTGDTHTILNVKSSSVSIADKFTLNVNGAAYTLGEEFSDANGSKYVINFADADGDTVANDLVIEVTVRKPNLSTSDVYVGNLTGKDGVAVHDTADKLTVFESDGTMSEGAVWGLGDWDMLDIADVNGDGADDILISYQHNNNVTGVAALINQQDGSYGMVHQDIRGWANDEWEYLCSADVNGDGTEDILTIETDSLAAGRDKNVNAWIMDSTGQYSADMRICGKNTDWEIEGFGDVTGDGKADGILRFKELVAFWEHDGKNNSVLKEVGQMSTSWKVIGNDDFTGDGLADILFGNSSAQYKLWTDIGEKSYKEINLGTMKDSSLELAGIGDFNGDGKADILWQAADGGLHWGEAESGKLNNLITIA